MLNFFKNPTAKVIRNYEHLTTATIVSVRDYSVRCMYLHTEHKIILSITEIDSIAAEFRMPYETVAKVVLLHEIGHSLDPDCKNLLSKYHAYPEDKIIQSLEKRAWKIADTLDTQLSNTVEYKILKKDALASYGVEGE